MKIASRTSQFLHALGLTRIALFSLIGYFLYCLVLQQHLPHDEYLFHSPFDDSLISIVCTMLILLMLYAMSQEFSRPRVLVHSPGYWPNAALFLIVGSVYFTFFYSFGFTKSLIPILNPYGIDPLLQSIEIKLHGGVMPMAWIIDHAPTWFIQLVSYTYFVAWMNVMVIYLLWQMGKRPSKERTLFLSSYVLLWIFVGTVSSTLLSSVGPIYYSLFYHDAYATMNDGLMQKLSVHYQALSSSMYTDVRQLLIGFMRDGDVVHFNGMSAMPSMHNASMILCVLHSWRTTRWLRYGLLLFAILIFLGSVTLGWHYAIDTYAAIPLVLAIWYLVRHELGITKRHALPTS